MNRPGVTVLQVNTPEHCGILINDLSYTGVARSGTTRPEHCSTQPHLFREPFVLGVSW